MIIVLEWASEFYFLYVQQAGFQSQCTKNGANIWLDVCKLIWTVISFPLLTIFCCILRCNERYPSKLQSVWVCVSVTIENVSKQTIFVKKIRTVRKKFLLFRCHSDSHPFLEVGMFPSLKFDRKSC